MKYIRTLQQNSYHPALRLSARGLSATLFSEKLWTLSLFLCVLLGCGQRHKKPSNFSENPDPYIKKLQGCIDSLSPMRGAMSITAWRAQERLKLEQLFIYSGDGKLRVDTLSPTGIPASTLASDGSQFMLHDHFAGRFFYGVPSKEIMQRFLLVNMSPKSLSTLLGGCVPMEQFSSLKLVWDKERGQAKLLMGTPTSKSIVWFDSQRRAVEMEQWVDQHVIQIRLGDFRQVGKVERPMKLRYTDRKTQIQNTLHITELTDIELHDETMFELSPPPGMSIETL